MSKFHSFLIRLTKSTVFRSLNILPSSDKAKIVFVVLIQIGLGLLDLAGVAILGVLGALAVNGVASRGPGDRVSYVLEFLGLNNQSLQSQVAALGIIVATLLIGKTIISIVFTKRILVFLSRRGAVISSDLLKRLLAQPLQNLQENSMQQNLYAVTAGVSTITVGVLGTSVSLIADFSLLIILIAGLFIVDTLMALSTLMLFSLIGLTLYKLMNSRAHTLGISQANLNIVSNQKITEILGSYREAFVKHRRDYYANEIGAQRLKLADIGAEIAFMPNVSKYVIELTVVIGSLAVSAIQFATQDAPHAVAVLSVFLAASSRIAPAVLRVQQGAITIRTSLGAAEPSLKLFENLKRAEIFSDFELSKIDVAHEGFISVVTASGISLTYKNSKSPAVKDIDFTIAEGESVAIVGASGAGKTTLIDLLLGILEPDSGGIEISGLAPIDAIRTWPGSVAYVPQDILIIDGTIRQNVTMGYPPKLIDDELVWSALAMASLEDYVRKLPNGLDTSVGDRGVNLSGGERQRLGIARAMFTRPKLLVFDEATSALDGQTEAEVSSSIQSLHGRVTVILIAHRLSSVQKADRVFYMSEGKMIAEGNFAYVRSQVPNFDEQARLMGL